jgi:hypothetical protein
MTGVSVLTALASPDDTDGQAGLRSVSIAVSALDCFAAHPELGAIATRRLWGGN